LAIELRSNSGIDLIPKDPIAAAKMRLEIEAFNSKANGFWPIIYHNYNIGTDTDVIDKFGAELLPHWEAIAAKATDDKWLFGTPEPTLMDVMICPFFEILYLWQEGVM